MLPTKAINIGSPLRMMISQFIPLNLTKVKFSLNRLCCKKGKLLQTLKKNTLVYKHHYTNKLYEVKFKIVRKSIKLLAETWYMVIKQKNQLNAI